MGGGTRGIFGWFLNRKFYVFYNHNNSYDVEDECLGEVGTALKSGEIKSWKTSVSSLKVINGTIPTEVDIKKLQPFTDLSVSSQTTQDWYCLLRNTQGSLKSVLNCGYLENFVNEQNIPHWQDVNFIVNLDKDQIDFYDSNGKCTNSTKFTSILKKGKKIKKRKEKKKEGIK